MQCLSSWMIFFLKPRLILLFYGTFCRYARFCCSQSSCFLGTLYYTQNTVSRIKASDLCFGAECFGKKSHCDKRLLKPKKRSTSTPHPQKIFPTIFWYDDFSDTEYGKIDPQCAPRRHNGAILLKPDGIFEHRIRRAQHAQWYTKINRNDVRSKKDKTNPTKHKRSMKHP